MNKTMIKYKSNSCNNINNNNSSNNISNNNSNKYSNNNNSNSNSKNNSNYKNHQSYNTPPPYNKVNYTKDIEFYELSDEENDNKRESYMFNKLTDDPYLTRYPEEDKEYFNQLRMMVNNITDKNISDQDLKNILSSFVVQVRLVDNNGKIHPVVVNALSPFTNSRLLGFVYTVFLLVKNVLNLFELTSSSETTFLTNIAPTSAKA